MRFGVVNLLRSVQEEINVAAACEAVGFWGLGLGDTVPGLYLDTYVTASACLRTTSTLHVGPTVTNTVARHWSVLAATARTFEELAPGRFFAGIGTGDGAVHSVGLRPSPWAKLERDIVELQSIAPPGLEIHVAASGPRGAEAAGRVASDLMLGTGLDVAALKTLAARARAARAAAGITTPLRIWTVADVCVVATRSSVDAARTEMRPRANGFARFAFATTFEDKAVPDQWQPALRQRLSGYDFTSHGSAGATPNAGLFDDVPALQDYLIDRFLLIGTAEECAGRLRQVADEAGLDGTWLAIGRSAIIDDPAVMVRLAGEAFADLATA
jgi:alkanesulfonate monooxygenase SsuD/methylene tetrahydromethanopterin reductase-like flavin-dependent oxidoreductase (luciferase family)